MTAVQSDEMLVKAQILQIVLQCYCHSKCTKAGQICTEIQQKRKKNEEYLILSKSIHKYTVKNFILQIQP